MKLNNKENARSIHIAKQQNKLMKNFKSEVKKYGQQHFNQATKLQKSLSSSYEKHGYHLPKF